MNTAQRVTITDSIGDVMFKISEGNPGALTVLMETIKQSARIDPDFAFGGSPLAVLPFDAEGIYGSRIWMLFKDVCKQDLSRTLAVLRGLQLGFISTSAVKHAIEHYGQGLDLEDVCRKVKERLPRFQLSDLKKEQPPCATKS